jgi:hypothetical protein
MTELFLDNYLPTMTDKLLFILTSVTQHPIQEVQGQLLGMSQANAHQWIHLLHPVLTQALADQGLLPARTADDLATRLTTHQSDDPSSPPLLCKMGPNAQSSAPKIPRIRKSIIVARSSVTP